MAAPLSTRIDVYGPGFQFVGRAPLVFKLNGVHGELGDGVEEDVALGETLGATLGETLGDALDEATWRETMRAEPVALSSTMTRASAPRAGHMKPG